MLKVTWTHGPCSQCPCYQHSPRGQPPPLQKPTHSLRAALWIQDESSALAGAHWRVCPKSPTPLPSTTQAIDEDGSGFISEPELTEALMQASGLVDGVSRSEVSKLSHVSKYGSK